MKAKAMISAAMLTAVLAGCGASPALVASVPMAAPAVGAQSFKGVGDALTRSVQRKFAEKDLNKNKVITPDEYGIKTPEDFVDFQSLDDNHDGKITLAEMLPGFWDKLSAWAKIRKTAAFMFHQLDKNGDKRLSPAEAAELNFPGVEDKWSKFAGGKNKVMDKGQFENFFAELLINGDKGAKPPAPPAPGSDS